jgi:hypothetical protein
MGTFLSTETIASLESKLPGISYAFIEELFLTKITSKKSRNISTVNISLPK